VLLRAWANFSDCGCSRRVFLFRQEFSFSQSYSFFSFILLGPCWGPFKNPHKKKKKKKGCQSTGLELRIPIIYLIFRKRGPSKIMEPPPPNSPTPSESAQLLPIDRIRRQDSESIFFNWIDTWRKKLWCLQPPDVAIYLCGDLNRERTVHSVINSLYIRFWPTLKWVFALLVSTSLTPKLLATIYPPQ